MEIVVKGPRKVDSLVARKRGTCWNSDPDLRQKKKKSGGEKRKVDSLWDPTDPPSKNHMAKCNMVPYSGSWNRKRTSMGKQMKSK